MANRVRVYTQAIWQTGGVRLMARVETDDGTDIRPVVQADLSAISYTVTPPAGIAGTPVSLTIADVVYDTLQTGDVWTAGGGFNFNVVLPGTLFSLVGNYVVSVKFTLVSPATSPAFLVFQLKSQAT